MERPADVHLYSASIAAFKWRQFCGNTHKEFHRTTTLTDRLAWDDGGRGSRSRGPGDRSLESGPAITVTKRSLDHADNVYRGKTIASPFRCSLVDDVWSRSSGIDGHRRCPIDHRLNVHYSCFTGLHSRRFAAVVQYLLNACRYIDCQPDRGFREMCSLIRLTWV